MFVDGIAASDGERGPDSVASVHRRLHVVAALGPWVPCSCRSSRCSLRHSAGGPPSRRPNPVLLGRPSLSPRAISPRPRARRRRRVSTEWEWGQLRVTSAPNLVDEAHQRVTDVIYWSQQQPTPATAAAAAAAGNRDAPA